MLHKTEAVNVPLCNTVKDGAATSSEDRILVIGATNRPQEIDEAARRRFVKRLLIPLPEAIARRQIVINLMSQQNVSLSDEDVQAICDRTDGEHYFIFLQLSALIV